MSSLVTYTLFYNLGETAPTITPIFPQQPTARPIQAAIASLNTPAPAALVASTLADAHKVVAQTSAIADQLTKVANQVDAAAARLNADLSKAKRNLCLSLALSVITLASYYLCAKKEKSEKRRRRSGQASSFTKFAKYLTAGLTFGSVATSLKIGYDIFKLMRSQAKMEESMNAASTLVGHVIEQFK